MDPLIAVVLVVLGVAMGWIARVLWSSWRAKVKHRKLMADLRSQFEQKHHGALQLNMYNLSIQDYELDQEQP